jgi:hypothetical protein
MFENKVLRRIFRLKSEDFGRGWRKLYNEELHNLCSPPNIIRMIRITRMRWAGHVAPMREKRNAYRILVGNPERERELGRSRCMWEDILKVFLEKEGRLLWT